MALVTFMDERTIFEKVPVGSCFKYYLAGTDVPNIYMKVCLTDGMVSAAPELSDISKERRLSEHMAVNLENGGIAYFDRTDEVELISPNTIINLKNQ